MDEGVHRRQEYHPDRDVRTTPPPRKHHGFKGSGAVPSSNQSPSGTARLTSGRPSWPGPFAEPGGRPSSRPWPGLLRPWPAASTGGLHSLGRGLLAGSHRRPGLAACLPTAARVYAGTLPRASPGQLDSPGRRGLNPLSLAANSGWPFSRPPEPPRHSTRVLCRSVASAKNSSAALRSSRCWSFSQFLTALRQFLLRRASARRDGRPSVADQLLPAHVARISLTVARTQVRRCRPGEQGPSIFDGFSAMLTVPFQCSLESLVFSRVVVIERFSVNNQPAAPQQPGSAGQKRCDTSRHVSAVRRSRCHR